MLPGLPPRPAASTQTCSPPGAGSLGWGGQGSPVGEILGCASVGPRVPRLTPAPAAGAQRRSFAEELNDAVFYNTYGVDNDKAGRDKVRGWTPPATRFWG